jgi:hypothetical protein
MNNEYQNFDQEPNAANPEPEAANASSSKNPLEAFIEHQKKAAEETAKALNALIPPDFRTHGRAAKHEFLTSFKVLIEGVSAAVDHELHKMHTNKSEGNDGPSTTGKTKVKVEVS